MGKKFWQASNVYVGENGPIGQSFLQIPLKCAGGKSDRY